MLIFILFVVQEDKAKNRSKKKTKKANGKAKTTPDTQYDVDGRNVAEDDDEVDDDDDFLDRAVARITSKKKK